jgi:Mycoplasma protein of unknown function, DUF285
MKYLFGLLFFFSLFGVMAPAEVEAAPITAGSFSGAWRVESGTNIQVNLGSCPTAVYWESLADENINGTNFTCDVDLNTVVDFGSGGEYRVDFSGNFTLLSPTCADDALIDVAQWGDSQWRNMFFSNCTDLVSFSANDEPDLSGMQITNYMFFGATSFNHPLNDWDVSTIDSMEGMFFGASSFNQPLNSWNVSNVVNFASMFEGASSFNQSLATWDTSSGTLFQRMFEGTSSFNQSIRGWQLPKTILQDSSIDSVNYADTLIGWAALNISPEDVGTIPATYCDSAQAARDTLVADGWTIVDLGPVYCATTVEVEESTGSRSSGTKVGVRAERLSTLPDAVEAASTTPDTGSIMGFIEKVEQLINYLTSNEAELETLPAEERNRIIIALRDIIAFLLKFVPAGE